MAGINVDELSLKPEQVVAYFNPLKFSWAVFVTAFIVACIGFAFHQIVGFVIIVAYIYYLYARSKKQKTLPTDKQIDDQWAQIAKQREDEAYRVAHIEKSDALRDAQYFFTGPWEIQAGDNSPNLKFIVGKDEFIRRNYQRLVYMIYTQNQLIVFDENICIEDNWEGVDKIREYYWKDVSSIEFDQKTNTLALTCGGKDISFPLQGDENLVTSFINNLMGNSDKYVTSEAEEISNSIRVMLREIKNA